MQLIWLMTAAAEHGEVYMLGTIVHNERVIENLDNAGAKVVKKIDEVPDENTVIPCSWYFTKNYGKKQKGKI